MKTILIIALTWFAGCAPDPITSSIVPKKVAILIANNGFFYQEYADPRSALEARGVEVTVLAGTIASAIPHADTGQGVGIIGAVNPDSTVSQAKASDYDALVISGGWGATKYYYAFTGTVDDPAWAPDTTLSDDVNTLIGEFLAQGKTVVGVCNGVNVLSWARVSGLSPLNGKTVSAPFLEVPAQTYLSVHYTPSNTLPMYTFAVDNGATVQAFNSVGNTGSHSGGLPQRTGNVF